jgi:ABC-type amino acid transport substrate-binding protein
VRRLTILALAGLLLAACSGSPPNSSTATPTVSAAPSEGYPLGGDRWDESAIIAGSVIGARYLFTCPPGGFEGFVWGTDVYTTGSSVCSAAVHAGLITFAGGSVVIEIRPGLSFYAGSERNGVSSRDNNNWDPSFVFVSNGQPLTPAPTAATTPAPTPTGSAGEYLQPGALLICMPFNRIRFAERDSSGNATGVDVEIGQQIGARLARTAQLIETPFDDLIDEIEQRRCDLTIGGQFITQGRLERIDMIPYRQGNPHVIVQAGNPHDIEELIDLCGRSFAVVAGTVYVDMVNGTGDYVGEGLDDQCASAGAAAVDLREYAVQTEAEDALADGDVAAYAGNDFITQDQPSVYELAVELPIVRNGIGHLLGAAVLDAEVRAALRAMISDGTYEDILERYGVAGVALTESP